MSANIRVLTQKNKLFSAELLACHICKNNVAFYHFLFLMIISLVFFYYIELLGLKWVALKWPILCKRRVKWQINYSIFVSIHWDWVRKSGLQKKLKLSLTKNLGFTKLMQRKQWPFLTAHLSGEWMCMFEEKESVCHQHVTVDNFFSISVISLLQTEHLYIDVCFSSDCNFHSSC